MIKVEMRMPSEGSVGYETVATLCVEDDQSWSVSGDKRVVDLSLRVIDRSSGEAIAFDDDPAGWARNLSGSFRTGYLVAVVVEDTAPQIEGK